MALFQKDTDIPNAPSRPASPPASRGANDGAGNTRNIEHTESRLTVGPNIKLKGVEIEDCDTLIVEGYVEASMHSRVIEIAETGVYKGRVEIDTAIVHGRFEGDLIARNKILVHASGDVRGKIRYGRLAIEEGGRVHGDLDELVDTDRPTKPSSPPDADVPTEPAA